MSPRTGRPTDNPKQLSTRVRLSQEDVDRLEYCAEKNGQSKADNNRQGIKSVYARLKREE